MISQDGVVKNIGDSVWVAGFEGKDTFWKPLPRQLKPNFKLFYNDFQNCVEYCKMLNQNK
jgi:hypothetical protein